MTIHYSFRHYLEKCTSRVTVKYMEPAGGATSMLVRRGVRNGGGRYLLLQCISYVCIPYRQRKGSCIALRRRDAHSRL